MEPKYKPTFNKTKYKGRAKYFILMDPIIKAPFKMEKNTEKAGFNPLSKSMKVNGAKIVDRDKESFIYYQQIKL
jgi:hypothetical protein